MDWLLPVLGPLAWCFSHPARIVLQLNKISELLIDQALADSSGGQ